MILNGEQKNNCPFEFASYDDYSDIIIKLFNIYINIVATRSLLIFSNQSSS
jgi:hypothetical protein